jgi:hypothetical protein
LDPFGVAAPVATAILQAQVSNSVGEFAGLSARGRTGEAGALPQKDLPSLQPSALPVAFVPLQAIGGQPEVIVAVHPSGPGNQLVVQGQRVTVDGIVKGADGRPVNLEVSVDPVAASPVSVAADPRRSASHSSRMVRSGGLTYEEELFRTKWGWAAFDAARRAAMEAAEGRP